MLEQVQVNSLKLQFYYLINVEIFLYLLRLVFDVFAGVGPFVVPASMLGCTVYANDINPECFKWMNINLKK
ncbi:unnamed protein product, partial [Rotaria sp. Silwood2]